MGKKSITAALAVAVVSLTACETTGTGMGTSLANGGSGGSGSTHDDIYRCDKPLGHVAIRDLSDDRYRSRYRDALNGDSMGAILREAVQASNCFKVIAVADDAVNKDLDKVFGEQQTSSRVKPGSDLQDGQANVADYVIYPTVIFSEQETGSGGLAGAGVALLGSKIPIIAGGGAKTNIKSSEMALELWSVRSRTRLAGGNGSAKVRDYSFAFAGIPGIPAGGAFTQASKSPAGKATLEAMIKAYNEMVIGLQNYEEQESENSGTGGLLESN